jgi:ABC-2 type transport system ATP-binding protein
MAPQAGQPEAGVIDGGANGAAAPPPQAPADATPVRARRLVKRYGEILAVDNVDLNVHEGDVYGFLGPNGAGKTTTLRMCLGLITPTEGSVELFGRDPMRQGAAALQDVAGFVEAPRFYPYLSGRKNLELLAALDGRSRKLSWASIEETLELVELSSRGDDRVGGYSHGMRQRLGIAAALLRRPRLLILDEPATGLDPAGMRDMRVLVRRLAAEGMTVLLSSHQLPEVQELCDRVAIVNSGKVVYEGELAALRRGSSRSWRLHTADDTRALRIAGAQPGIHDVRLDGSELHLTAEEDEVGSLSLALGAAGVAILGLTPELARLEDLFFRLTEGSASQPEGSASQPNEPAMDAP